MYMLSYFCLTLFGNSVTKEMKYLKIKDTLKLVSEFDEKNLEQFINDHKLHKMIVLLCLNGEMVVNVNMKAFQLTTSSLMTICPHQNVKLESISKDFRCYVITIQQELLTKAFYVKNVLSIESILFQNPIVLLDEKAMALFVHYFSFLSQIHERINGNHPEIIRCHLMALLMSLNAIYKGKDQEARHETMTRSKIICHDFVELVRKHYAEEHQLNFYADKLFITPKHLMAVIKKNTGKNPKKFIDEALIADAKLQLKTTDLCVKQICDNLNFPNSSFFGKFFKQHVGVSPNAYRRGFHK